MKNKTKMVLQLIAAGVLLWILFTITVQLVGKGELTHVGDASAEKQALVIYDPDPLYNLDEQVCESFAKGLSEKGWAVRIYTVEAAHVMKTHQDFDLYVFCANTYNFAPDKVISTYIKESEDLQGKQVAAITLGSGNTDVAQRKFENNLLEKGASILGSRAFWLMRPNDQNRIRESNVKVAIEMAYQYGTEMAIQYDSAYTLAN